MRWWGIAAALIVLVSLSGVAYAIEGFSGSIWGTVAHDTAEDETFTIGHIYQGIDWFEYRGLRLSTFAQFRYRFLTPQGTTFDAYGPSLGIAFYKAGISLGAEYFWQHKRSTGAFEEGPRFFVEWYFGWDLKKIFRAKE